MASEGKNLIGVDIGADTIKVCELKESRKGVRTLARLDVYPLPPETIVDGQIINSGAVVEGLEALFEGERRRNIALRAGGHSVIIKKIPMPLMTVAELEEQINWEAEQHIPFDLREVFLDYQVLQERADHGQMDVLLVAAKKEEISDLTNLAVEAGLKPIVVDLDAFAIQNVFETAYGPPDPNDTIVLVHIGASVTTVNILAEGTTAFTRDITNGGNSITEEIQRQLSVSREEAESLKCGGDGSGVIPNEVPQIINQVCEQLAGEIQRSLDFYLATSGDRDLTRIYVSGGTANILSLLDAIEQRSRVPIQVLDVARVIEGDEEGLEILGKQGPQSAVAIGLALRKERERN